MSVVDDRIVNMEFHNRDFTKNVDQSKRDLTGLEKTITNLGKTKGMENLEGSTARVTQKFSAMQVAGVAAIGTIASKATMMAGSFLKGFTIQPIMDGFREYQTGLESVQTIMSNTGKPVKAVNKALDQLNTYADQTIYNFAEMARNVGTFTAAGVGLKTSVESIKGIANLAAMSGSNSQQASTAMYQLSQAIASGKVGLQDWNSVVNAGMGGKVFQTALSRTAENMGTLTKGAVSFSGELKKIKINGESFRDSISARGGEQWMTGEVLVETLKQISGGYTVAELRAKGYTKTQAKEIRKLARRAFNAATQIKTLPQLIGVVKESIGSTFAQAFRTIIGDFQQSKKLWGDVGFAIIGPRGWLTKIQEGFTNTLKGWAEAGGRNAVIAGFKNMFKGLGRVVGAFRDAFVEIFPPATGKQLADISKGFERFTKNLIPSKDNVENLKSIFKGFFSVLHIGWSVIKGIGGAFGAFFTALFSGTTGARGGFLSLFGSLGDVLTSVDKFLTSGGKMQRFLSGIGLVAGAALKPLVTTISSVVDGFSALVSGEGLGAAMGAFGKAKDVFSNFVGEIVHGLDELTAPLDPIKDKIASWALSTFGPFEDMVAYLDEIRLRIVEALGLDTVLPTASGIMAWFDDIKEKVTTFASEFKMAAIPLHDFGDAIDWVVQKAQQLADKIDFSGKLDSVKSAASGLMNKVSGAPASAGAAGAAAGDATGKAMTATAEKSAAAYEKVKGFISGIGDAIGAVIGLLGQAASSIGSKLAGLFPSDALEWATVLNTLLAGALIKKLFFSKGVFESLSDTIRQVGESLTESFGELNDTLGAMQTNLKADALKNIAIAIALLVGSLVLLSMVPAEKLKTGLSALVLVLAAMVGAFEALARTTATMSISVVAGGIVLMASAVLILTGAIAALGDLPLAKLQQGLSAFALIMGALIMTIAAMSKFQGKMLGAAAGMVLMASAVNTVVLAIVALGMIPLDVLQQGLAAVALIIGALVIALVLLSKRADAVFAASAAMVLVAAAVNMLVLAVAALGVLPLDVLQQGLAAVALMLGGMVIALVLLSENSVGVMAAGAAMLMIASSMNILVGAVLALGAAPWDVVKQGLGAMAIALVILLAAGALAGLILPGLYALSGLVLSLGAAMLMAGTGMALFGAGLALVAGAGVAVIGIITAAIAAFIIMLPQIAVQMAAAFVSFVQAIALAAPKIRKAFGTILKNILGTVRDAIPEIGKLLSQLIETGLDVIKKAVPDYVEAGFTIIDEFLKSAEAHVPNIVQSATDLAIFFIEELGNKAVDLAQAGLDMLVTVMDGLSDAIENSDRVRKAAGNLARTFMDELRETFTDLFSNFSLPDIPLPGNFKAIGKVLGRGLAAGEPGAGRGGIGRNGPRQVAPVAVALEKAGIEVAKAIEVAVRLLTNATSGKAYNLMTQAKATQKDATYKSVQAEERDISATRAVEAADARLERAQNIKNKAKRKKAVTAARKAVKAADKQRQSADRIAAQAAAAQEKADLQAQKAQDEIAYNNADWAGKGDIRSQQGEDLADRAQALVASAQAKSDEAARLAKGTKKDRNQAKRLRKEAAKEAEEARKLALEAQTAQREALSAYAEARKVAALDVLKRMEDVRKQKADRLWQEEYEKASSETKISMLEKRAAENEAAAAKASVEMDKALTAGAAIEQIIADGGTVSEAQLKELEAALTAAETNSQLAWQAADQAKADRDQIKQLQDEIAGGRSGGTPGGSGPTIMPSRTALEDAALAVDRYQTSVIQAEEMARSAGSPTQFVQNNYSPESLSASAIYRQTRNLVSAAEIKMGANT